MGKDHASASDCAELSADAQGGKPKPCPRPPHPRGLSLPHRACPNPGPSQQHRQPPHPATAPSPNQSAAGSGLPTASQLSLRAEHAYPPSPQAPPPSRLRVRSGPKRSVSWSGPKRSVSLFTHAPHSHNFPRTLSFSSALLPRQPFTCQFPTRAAFPKCHRHPACDISRQSPTRSKVSLRKPAPLPPPGIAYQTPDHVALQDPEPRIAPKGANRLPLPPSTSTPCPNGTPYASPKLPALGTPPPHPRVLKERRMPANHEPQEPHPHIPNHRLSPSLRQRALASYQDPALHPQVKSPLSPHAAHSEHASLRTSSRRLWTAVSITALPAHGVRLPASLRTRPSRTRVFACPPSPNTPPPHKPTSTIPNFLFPIFNFQLPTPPASFPV